MSRRAEVPVTLEAWVRVEDGNVTGLDLCLDTVALDDATYGRTAFEYVPGDDDATRDLTVEEARKLFDDLPSRRDWAITRVENSDGGVYMDE